jgi:hypothetical protein
METEQDEKRILREHAFGESTRSERMRRMRKSDEDDRAREEGT